MQKNYTSRFQPLSPLRRALFAVCICTLCTLSSCGVESVDQASDSGSQDGGTEDAGAIQISGTLKGSDGAALSGIIVTCMESGASAQSATDGGFELASAAIGSSASISFLIEGAGIEVTSNGVNVSQDASSVQVNIVLSADKNSANAELLTESAPLPTPPPGDPSVTPAPTAAPSTPSSGPFDADGNTTKFGIPNGFTGNVHRGKKKYIDECSACHSGLVGTDQDFSQLKRTIAGDPMNISMHDANLSDIVAYLHFKR